MAETSTSSTSTASTPKTSLGFFFLVLLLACFILFILFFYYVSLLNAQNNNNKNSDTNLSSSSLPSPPSSQNLPCGEQSVVTFSNVQVTMVHESSQVYLEYDSVPVPFLSDPTRYFVHFMFFKSKTEDRPEENKQHDFIRLTEQFKSQNLSSPASFYLAGPLLQFDEARCQFHCTAKEFIEFQTFGSCIGVLVRLKVEKAEQAEQASN